MNIKGHIQGLSQSFKHKQSKAPAVRYVGKGSYPTHLLSVTPSTAFGGGHCQDQGKRRDSATETAVAMELIHK